MTVGVPALAERSLSTLKTTSVVNAPAASNRRIAVTKIKTERRGPAGGSSPANGAASPFSSKSTTVGILIIPSP